jgi:PST family polysaccharide transporter
MQGASYILPLITLPYLVRVLGPGKFGLVAFAQAFIGYFSILTNYGFNLSATREVSIHRDDKQKVSEIFSSVITIQLLLAVISFIIMALIVFSFSKFSKDWLLYFFTFGVIVGNILFPVWFFQGLERMKYITILNVLARIIFTIAIFIFIRNESDYVYVPLLNSVGFTIAGIMAMWIVFKIFRVKFKISSINEIKTQLKEGWPIFISQIGMSMYRNFNLFALGIITNNVIVGYYAIAEKIIYAIQGLQGVIGQALFPYFSSKFKNLPASESAKFIFRYSKPFLLFYFILFIIVFIFPEKFVYLISGRVLINTVINLKILSTIIIIGGLNYYFGILGLVSMGYSNLFKRFVLIAGISNIVIVIFLIILFKDIGASISIVLSESILLFLILKNFVKLSEGVRN